MGNATRVTACLVLFESARDLPPLLASLAAQSRPIDELVICINGPDLELEANLHSPPFEVRVLRRPDNPGFAGGMNACIAASSGSHVLTLNPDVVLASDYVEVCLSVFTREEKVAGVGGKLMRPGEGGARVDSAGFAIQPWLRIVDRGGGSLDDGRFAERESVLGVCAAAALFRRQALEAVAEKGEVFDEDFWMYKEDQDLALRLRAAGWRILFEPRAIAAHERGWSPGSRDRVPLILRRHSLKNRYLLLAKHWRWGRHVAALPFVLAFEIFLFLPFSPGNLGQ